MKLIDQRAAQFPGNGPVVNDFVGTALGGWRTYVGRPAQPGDPAFVLAFNERTGVIVSGIGRGLVPHPALLGQYVLNIQSQVVLYP